ncbi:MAG TPA: metallophosphoesterase, partial [Chloroflexia bacterium]|nr:metallophosphoesterase [Chloroflexia bacterium]
VAIDEREGSKSDAHWDGSRLYIASAAFPTTGTDYRIDLLRYSYNKVAKTFSLDAGFPVRVDTGAVIAVVIDKDSTGRLWMTYTKPHVATCVDDPNGTYDAPTCTRDVFVTHGTTSENNVWVTPYVPRMQLQGSIVTQIGKDAISSLVPFGGGKMGLVWDHGNFSALYFTYHTDGAGDADSNWSPIVTVVRKADNHINLKSLLSDPAGKIYAVVKNDCNEPSGGGCSGTGTVNPNDALIWLFALDVSGVQSYTVSRVQDKQTRPMLGIDRQNRRLYVFATTGDPGGRSITVKQTPMDRISFEEGAGVPFIQNSTSTNINDATTTKQSMTSESGLVVLASDSTSRYYFHNAINLASADPVLVGAGDIARCDGTGDETTANLIAGLQGPFSVFTVGDNVYPDGRITYYNNCYQPSWGTQKYRTFPAAGNHEYFEAGAAGYYNYFGAAAGDPGKGYYSYDMGTWHIVVLNSNCAAVGGCGVGSPQEQWLRADLSANRDKNVLAYFHHPRFSSGASHGSNLSMKPFWQALYDYGAELVVNGHDHGYER